MIPIIILAGGKGTRISSSYPDVPKAMIPVNGRTFLSLLIDRHYVDGYRDFILATGYMYELIENYPWAALFPGATFRFARSDQGTGPAVKLAFHRFKLAKAWVVNGDTYPTFTLKEPHGYNDGCVIYYSCENHSVDCGTVFVTRKSLGIFDGPHGLQDCFARVLTEHIYATAFDMGTPDGLKALEEYLRESSKSSA